MNEDFQKPWRLAPRWWAAVLLLWTVLLVLPAHWFPGQVSRPITVGIGPGKLLHVGAYAVLAGATGWLPFPRRVRYAILAALVAHGGMTEALQTLVPSREGSLRDVGIDTFGVILGGLATGRRWPSDDATPR